MSKPPSTERERSTPVADRHQRPEAADRVQRPEAADRHQRPEAAERGVRRPESVLVVIHTPARECLLLERLVPEGFWQSVTGSLEWDETPAEAAAREVREETGLDPGGLRDAGIARRFTILPEWRRKFAPGVVENVEHLLYLEVSSPLPVVLNPREHRGYGWLRLEEAIARVGSWTNREALERLRP